MRHGNLAGALLATAMLLYISSLAAADMSSANVKGIEARAVRLNEKAVLPERVVAQKAQAHAPMSTLTLASGVTQGGETIATAVPITSMPFTGTGTTAGYTDDYEEKCQIEADQDLPDVVYSYTPAQSGLLEVISCESSFFTRLWIYRTNEDTLVDCNRASPICPALPRAALTDVELDAGATYYIVIDGDKLVGSGFGDYTIECAFAPFATLEDSSFVHPAVAWGNTDDIMFAWEEKATDTGLFWYSSIDGGQTIAAGGAFTGDYSYPSIDYWGNNGVFYGTMVPEASQLDGAPVYLAVFPDLANIGSWELSYWSWASYGWHDMKMADIACDNSQNFPQYPNEYLFGIISFISSTTYQGGLINGPHLFYQTSSPDHAAISFYGVDSCNSTTCDIDPISHLCYAVYDYYWPDDKQWQLFVRRDRFGDFDNETYSNGYFYALEDTSENIKYPAVATYDSNLVILSEYYSNAAPGDRDIICWYNPGSDGDHGNLSTSIVAASADDERFPRIAHLKNDIFLGTFLRDDTLFYVITHDAGATWTEPTILSPIPGDEVVREYRTSDLGEYGAISVWEYREAGSPDTSIFIHFSGISPDTDGDGIDEFEDNCPTVPNADQLDLNQNGIGDACEYLCGDANGDGSFNVGDPVYLIQFIFKGGPSPSPLESADSNCEEGVNVSDAVYMINAVFKGGPAPCACK